MKIETGYKLIEELLLSPHDFFNYGKTYDLLNVYFKGLPINTLIPLLTSSDTDVQKSAIWIASELTSNVSILLPYIVRLIDSDVKYIKYYALECVLSCANGEYISYIVYLINSINDDNIVMIHSMKLISNADHAQLTAGIEQVKEDKIKDYQLHIEGLTKLINIENIDEKEIINMLNSDQALLQRYAAIIIEKGFKNDFKLIDYALTIAGLDVKEYIMQLSA